MYTNMPLQLPWWLRLGYLPEIWESQIRSPAGEDALEEGIATHSRILA